jgi:integrase/recombinase XerD
MKSNQDQASFGAPMKNDRHGAAATLTEEQLDALLDAAPSPRYRALWAIQRWSAARIGEALALTWGDLNGVVTFRKANTKPTRQVPTSPKLAAELLTYRNAWAIEYGHAPVVGECLFPALGSTTQHQSRQAADKALRSTCAALGLEGVSTHSFRRVPGHRCRAPGGAPARGPADHRTQIPGQPGPLPRSG